MCLKILIAFTMLMLFFSPLHVNAQENEKEVVPLSTVSINGFYSQDSDSPAIVYEEGDNQFLKLKYSPEYRPLYSNEVNHQMCSFYFETMDSIYQNGTYRFEADLRYSDNLDTDNIFISLFNAKKGYINKIIATNVYDLNNITQKNKNSDWRRLTVYFTINDFFEKNYECFKFGFNTKGNIANYIDLDNISISRCTELNVSNENIDFGNNGDLSFSSEKIYDLNSAGWHLNNTYYVSENCENSIITETDNKVLKLYTSSVSTDITKSLKSDFAKEGLYILSFKAKAGKDFFTNNIGFRIYDSNGIYVGETNVDYRNINENDWVTITTPFYVNKDSLSHFFNLNLWVFTHNNQIDSLNNYVLIDDIEVHKVNTFDVGENLFSKGEIEKFAKNIGRKIFDIDYEKIKSQNPFKKEIINPTLFNSYQIGKQFIENCKEQGYWGTINYDVAAEIVEIEGNKAVLLSYDGKQKTKTHSSLSYLLDFVEMSINKYYVLEFDYQLELDSNDLGEIDVASVAFIGVDNESDYMIDLLNCHIGENYTSGVNKDVYTYEVTDNGDGWKHCRLIFKPNIDFKQRVTALRFLIDANFNENNKLILSNILMMEYSDVEYASSNAPIISESQPDYTFIYVAIGLIMASLIVTGVFVIKKKVGGCKNA